jgi:hypothetical protein
MPCSTARRPAARTASAGSPNSPICPLCTAGPKFWAWLNFRIGLQHTHWNKFNGASTNIDGMGRSAQANNTLFLYD